MKLKKHVISAKVSAFIGLFIGLFLLMNGTQAARIVTGICTPKDEGSSNPMVTWRYEQVNDNVDPSKLVTSLGSTDVFEVIPDNGNLLEARIMPQKVGDKVFWEVQDAGTPMQDPNGRAFDYAAQYNHDKPNTVRYMGFCRVLTNVNDKK